MHREILSTISKHFAYLVCCLAVAGCGGGGSSSSSPSSPAQISKVTGSAVKGVIESGLVEAFQFIDSNKVLVGSARTDSSGNFSLSFIDTFDTNAGLVLLELHSDNSTLMTCDVLPGCAVTQSGDYAEFGEQFNLPSNFMMQGVFNPSDNLNAYITPISHLIVASASTMPGGLNEENIDLATSWLQTDFRLSDDPLNIQPLDLTKLSDSPSALNLSNQAVRQTILNASLFELALGNSWSQNQIQLDDVALLDLIQQASTQANALEDYLLNVSAQPIPPTISQVVVQAANSLEDQRSHFEQDDLTIVSQPVSQNVSAGDPISLRVSAVSNTSSSVSYQWYKDGRSLAGETNSQLTISSARLGDSGSYRVEIYSDSITLSSATATIGVAEVTLPPTINQQPRSQSLSSGQTLRLEVSASGTGSLQYYWQKDGSIIPGANNASLVIENIDASDAGSYRVSISNNYGERLSQYAEISVIETVAPITIATQPQSQTALVGSSASLSVVATGGGFISYQWYKDGNRLNGATSNELVLTALSLSDDATYYVLVSNSQGSISSSQVQLSVLSNLPAMQIVSQPQDRSVQIGDSTSFSVDLLDATSVSYQWHFNDIEIPGAQNRTLSLSDITLEDQGFYHASIHRGNETLTSDLAELIVDPFTTLELAWGVPTQRINGEPLSINEISGYVIEYGQNASNLDREVQIYGAQTTNYVLEDISSGYLYLRIATVDSNNTVGGFSSIVSILIP